MTVLEQDVKKVDKEDAAGDDQVFIAFARVFSGTVRKGQKLYVLGPKHDPARALQEVNTRVILVDLMSVEIPYCVNSVGAIMFFYHSIKKKLHCE